MQEDDPNQRLLIEAIKSDSLRKIEREKTALAEKTIMTTAKLIAPVIDGSFASGFDWYVYTCRCAWKLLDIHKSKQGNTTNLNISFSMKNEKSCSVGTQTHDILLMRQTLYQLSYQGSSAGWVESRQYKARTTSLT